MFSRNDLLRGCLQRGHVLREIQQILPLPLGLLRKTEETNVREQGTTSGLRKVMYKRVGYVTRAT